MAQMPVTTERLNEVFNNDSRSDSDIAAFFGVSKQAISAWKNGTRSPKRSKLQEIADYYNKDIMWFFGISDTKKDSPISSNVDERVAEIISLVNNLPSHKLTEALRYLRYLANSEEDG